MWDSSFGAVREYLADESDTSLWYGSADMNTGEHLSSTVTLYDAYFPALPAYSGNLEKAEKSMTSWDGLRKLYGIEPLTCDFRSGEIKNPSYGLNPEIMESAFYLYQLTGNEKYRDMARDWE